jgi:hypothetical protein
MAERCEFAGDTSDNQLNVAESRLICEKSSRRELPAIMRTFAERLKDFFDQSLYESCQGMPDFPTIATGAIQPAQRPQRF